MERCTARQRCNALAIALIAVHRTGLFEWSMHYQDGTKPTGQNHQEWTPERKKWLEEAMQSYMKDFADRMNEIKDALDDKTTTPATLEEKEALLEELMDVTASIDYARDLHKIGGLHTLLSLLQSPHPSLKWRAAEVVSTCVQNNPPVQEWFMQGGVLPPLLVVLGDTDPLCSSKGLLAISSLIRHFPPALLAFRQAGGVSKLVELMRADDTRQQRKAISTLQYMVTEVPGDAAVACRQNALPALEGVLSHEEGSSREAALNLLLEIAKQSSCSRYVQQVESLPAAVRSLQDRHQRLSMDEQEACAEEMELCQQLLTQLQETNTYTSGTMHQSESGGDAKAAAAGGTGFATNGDTADSVTSTEAGFSGLTEQGRQVGVADGTPMPSQLLHDRSLGLTVIHDAQ